ncbi:MAG: HAMP domain-containing histidine kinase [Chitinophagaceae bacterium]|nr:HAMP domain-containing histidine kinase [Chitinophagaceae bacterium]
MRKSWLFIILLSPVMAFGHNTGTDVTSRLNWIIIILALLLVAAGVYITFLARQISQHKKDAAVLLEQQDQIMRSNEEIQKLNKVKDKIFAIISHDLRSPLTSTHNLLDLLNQGLISHEEFAPFSKQLQNDVLNTLILTENLLNWSKTLLNGIVPYQREFKVQPVIDEVIQTLQSLARAKDIMIENHVKDRSVFTDADMLKMIVRNILSNAIKFTPHGKMIHIQEFVNDNKLLIQIVDEGVGMSQEKVDQLNHKMAESTRGTDNEKGTGIGMRLVLDMIAALGETITISSEEGEGTTVSISVSLASA